MPKKARSLRIWLLLALPFVLLLVELLFPEVALARGGGGGHGGGGGGGSGGGGGHSGGGGSYTGSGGYTGSSGYGGGGLGILGVFLVFGFIGLIILLIVFFALRGRGGTPEYTEYQQEPERPDPSAGLDAIKAADPVFELESFLQRSQMAFFLVKKAWQDLDVHAGRMYLTPEAFQPWSASVEEVRAQGLRPVLENLNVQGLWVASAQRGQVRDAIVVHFDVVAAPHYIDATTGQVRSGTTTDQRAGEDWLFERDAGTLTVQSGGVTAQKCPSCGAPLQLDEVGQCRFCKADVTSGKFDWVVAAMDTSEFQGGGTPAPAMVGEPIEDGMARIAAADAGFKQDAFLNRAYLGFMALEQCWMDRNLDAGRVYMSPGLYMSWSAQVQQLIQLHKKNILENLRVTNMQVARVGHSDGYDNITVRIDATCADYEVDEQTGKIIFGSKHESPFAEYWTFQRSAGAQTKNGGIIEKICPNCGAPLQINQVGECQYCKAAVTSGRFDWVLSRIDQENEWQP